MTPVSREKALCGWNFFKPPTLAKWTFKRCNSSRCRFLKKQVNCILMDRHLGRRVDPPSGTVPINEPRQKSFNSFKSKYCILMEIAIKDQRALIFIRYALRDIISLSLPCWLCLMSRDIAFGSRRCVSLKQTTSVTDFLCYYRDSIWSNAGFEKIGIYL